MPKRNRATLRKRFGDGEMPSVGDFGDLIESMLNIQDDGIAHNDRDGLRLTQIGRSSRILSFYGDIEQKSVVWALGLDQHRSSLNLGVGGVDGEEPDDGDGGGHAVLTLLAPGTDHQPPRVGINQPHPQYTLDVGGTVSASGRIGAAGMRAAPADGQWHTITEPLSGCTALEVMAGAGRRNSGKYALMHAIAMKTFGAKGDFTYHHTHHEARRHRMQLQWVAADNNDKDAYQLQIRVNCAYGEGVWIRYHITSLWFDHRMEQCSVAPAMQDLA